MNTDFQDQLTRSILLLTPGMLLLAVLGVLGLLMMMERLGLLSARDEARRASPDAASASAPAASPAQEPGDSRESPK